MSTRFVHSRRCLRQVVFVAGFTLPLALAAAADEPGKVTYPQVSEAACPVKVVSIPGRAGNKVTAVVRQPPGTGRFPRSCCSTAG